MRRALRTWLERARRQRRRSAGAGLRRRALAFEQYEARIALSAESPVQTVNDAEFVYASSGVLLRFWSDTPGADAWGLVTFSRDQSLSVKWLAANDLSNGFDPRLSE